MKQFIIFAVAFVAVFAASIKMYGDSVVPEPNYYCAYLEDEGYCIVSVGTACYGIDENCEWLDEEEQSEDN